MPSTAGSRAAALAGLALLLAAAAPAPAQSVRREPDESDAFFKGGPIPRLVLEIDEAECAKLRAEPRRFAAASLRENEKTVYPGVSVKIKGAAGSFRPFDDQPSFTVKMDGEDDDQRFHGLRKFHLNKSVQDPTYLHEWLGSEVFRSAGIPTPRVAHARVRINGRDMGLYVLKEGFDRTLLRRWFEKPGGNLYDGGFCQDIDGDLERDEGKGEVDRQDLARLRAACREPDLVKRWTMIGDLVDVKSFVSFMAIELMLGHWDGYNQNRNNYRLYFDPSTGKAVFLPHGMDQILGDPGASILDNPVSLLGAAVMKNPAWRTEYRRRVGEFLPLFGADRLKRKVEDVAARLEPALKAWDREQARAFEGAVAGLRSRLEAREKSLREQRSHPEPRPLVFSGSAPARVARWRTASECDDASLAAEKDQGGEVLRIDAGPSGRCVASWRRSVLLAKGRYRFQAVIRAKGVEPLAENPPGPGTGAGIRISGGRRGEGLVGSSDWKRVEWEFEVAEEMADVDLVVELRAARGGIAIRADSLSLSRIEGER